METSRNLIELVDIKLTGQNGKIIFEGLNFCLPEGKTVVISGPTGSGKTQLINLIIGNLEPDTGSILIFGGLVRAKQLWQISEMRRKIGGVGGIFGLVSYQTVYENLLHPLILNRKTVAFQKNKMEQILSRFELTLKRDVLAGNLSQGEKNEAMLARAIIADQPLLLIDEPLSNVDTTAVDKIKRWLKRLSAAGHSMVILTCDPDRLGIDDAINLRLDNGRLV